MRKIRSKPTRTRGPQLRYENKTFHDFKSKRKPPALEKFGNLLADIRHT